MDFAVLNWSGFLAYSIYNLAGYLDPSCMPGKVDISDVVFGIHAWVLINITLVQCSFYDVTPT